jgi:hypothetical protein
MIGDEDMRKMSAIRRARAASGAAAALALTTIVAGAQTHGTPERFTALAVNFDSPSGGAAGTVEFVVDRWSTDAERDKLMTALMEKGPEKLLDVLQNIPRVGYIRTPNSVGYDLRYARRVPGEDGGERISLVTDRPITFWEASNRPRSIDYPFTVIELRIGPDGKGEGKLSIATKITADSDNKTIVLENYAIQPVLLQSVRREKK